MFFPTSKSGPLSAWFCVLVRLCYTKLQINKHLNPYG